MAILTVTDSENVAFVNGTQLPITITISNTINQSIEQYIDGFMVLPNGVPSATIAVGNIIRGVLNNRYIIAEVTGLPYTTETNLEFYLDNQK
jgi:hypothetical protein